MGDDGVRQGAGGGGGAVCERVRGPGGGNKGSKGIFEADLELIQRHAFPLLPLGERLVPRKLPLPVLHAAEEEGGVDATGGGMVSMVSFQVDA